jgi:hypothetical protein
MKYHRMAATVGLCVLFLGAESGATILYIAPGSACKYYSVQGNDSFFSTTGSNFNGIHNSGTTAVGAVCPSVRDGLTFAPTVAQAVVDGNSAWIPTTCNRLAVDLSGQTFATAPTPQMQSLSGYHIISWANWAPTGGGFGSGPHTQVIFCKVPVGASIFNYLIES